MTPINSDDEEFTTLKVRSYLFLQLNDIYQIDASADYSRSDTLILPRIASRVERLHEDLEDRVSLCVPGDFLAPSCLSKEFKGEQMVDILNLIPESVTSNKPTQFST